MARDSESDGEAEHVEHADVGGTDWLLQQLGGGRESRATDAPRDADQNGRDERDGESDGTTDLPAVGDGVPPAVPDTAPPTTASPKLRWSWESGTAEPIEQVRPIEQTDAIEQADAIGQAEPIGQADAISGPAPEPIADASTGGSAQQRPDLPAAPGNAERPPAQSATFNWALTPTDDVDPLVAPPASPASPSPPRANESGVADENVYFHPALPIPGMEPEVPAETTEIPVAIDETAVAAAETTEIPVAAAETTPIDFPEPPGQTPTAVIPAEPTGPLAAALERQRAESRSERPAAETEAVPVSAPAAASLAAASSSGAARSAASAASSSAKSGGPNRRTTRILFWVAGGLLVVLVLIGLYVFGTQIPGFVSAAPTPTPTATTTPTPTPTPTPTAQATGPQAPGVHAWDTLRGGECLNPFSSPWALKFTVVDCATPHAAQLVYTNVFSSDKAAAFPGDAQLASQINLLCTKPGIINLDAAGAFTDAQIQGSYPATEKQWKDGQRSYFCFVNRAGGEPLTGSIAGPGPAA